VSDQKIKTIGDLIEVLLENRPLKLVLDFLLKAQAQKLGINIPSRLQAEERIRKYVS